MATRAHHGRSGRATRSTRPALISPAPIASEALADLSVRPGGRRDSEVGVAIRGVGRWVRGKAAVDAQGLAGHECRVVRREERDGARDLFGIAQSPDEMARA